jgi:hypothetical protein
MSSVPSTATRYRRCGHSVTGSSRKWRRSIGSRSAARRWLRASANRRALARSEVLLKTISGEGRRLVRLPTCPRVERARGQWGEVGSCKRGMNNALAFACCAKSTDFSLRKQVFVRYSHNVASRLCAAFQLCLRMASINSVSALCKAAAPGISPL